MRIWALAIASAAVALGGCATTGGLPQTASADQHPEARLFDASRDATADVDAALARAANSGNHVLVVMGANWCHDSRALAGWTETARFAELLGLHYEVVFVNVGMPQTEDGHNLHIAKRFGIDEFGGTPTVLVLSSEGEVLNADTAGTWRNAASRSADSIYDELAGFVTETGG